MRQPTAPCRRLVLVRTGLGSQQPEQAADAGGRRREEPDGVPVVVAESELPDQGPDGEPAVRSQRVEADRLAAAVLRREVVDDADPADEEERLADAREQAQPDDRREVGRNHEAGRAQHHQRPAAHHQRPPSAQVAEPPRRRLCEQSRQARRADRDADPHAVCPERPFGVARQHGEHGTDREECEEGCRGHDEESGRHHPLS